MITWAGYQVQRNLTVPTCYPGIVKVRGEQYPPPAKKWSGVSTEGGKVEISWPLNMLEKAGRSRCGRREVVGPECITRLRRADPARHRLALLGIACSGCRPMVSASTDYNRAKALFGRVFRMPKANPWGRGPLPGTFQRALELVPTLLPGFRECSERLTDEAWIESMPARRRLALLDALILYRRTGWLKRYESFQAFVKTELLPGFAKDKTGIVPMSEMLDRLIQGPHDVAHCIAGPWLKPKIQYLKDIWTHDSPIFYGSCGPEPLHRWLNETLLAKKGWFFWCDFSMFDNTHSEESWDFMESLYGAAMADPDFRRVMAAWRRPSGRIGPFKYQARVMNASGRDDTALANGVLNGFASYLSVAAAWLDVPVQSVTPEMLWRVRPDICLSVTGDDSLGRVPEMSDDAAKAFRERVSANIAEFGFEAKFMMSRDVCDAVYLGMRPYPVKVGTDVKWFWGKTIGRATYKMGYTVLDKDKDLMAHITGIADMHVLCSSHVPVLADLAHKIVELREGLKRTKPVLDPNRPWEWTYQSGAPYTRETLEAVANAYTKRETPLADIEPHDVIVTVEDVEDLIEHIRAVDRLPCVVDHWLWRHMVWCDDL